MDEFLRILDSHISHLRAYGRIVVLVRMNRIEIGRCGLDGAVEVLGRPLVPDEGVEIGRMRFDVNDGRQYEACLPIRFTDDAGEYANLRQEIRATTYAAFDIPQSLRAAWDEIQAADDAVD